jgi:hypothetical protein
MNFDSASSVLTSISQMQWANQNVQMNRARINRVFNGEPPWTEDERIQNKIQTNVNWLEGTRIAMNSRFQMHNAFFKPGNFFDVRIDKGPVHKRDQWGRAITSELNRLLKRSRKLVSALEAAHAQVVLHGPGPSIWRNRKTPVVSPLGVENVLMPAGTWADFSNLDYLSIYNEWTWGELYEMTQGDSVDPGWNRDYIKKLLASLFKQPLQPLYQGNRWLWPEKIQEDIKENASAWSASALAKLLVWDFYFRDEKTGKWNRRIMLDYNNLSPESMRNDFSPERQAPDWLYSKDEYANDWSEIVHFFIGNCSNVAPFRYYSVRSIGYLLYGVCLYQNNLRCRLADHTLMQLLNIFRNVSEDDRERLENWVVHNMGVLPDGVSFLSASERHVADWNLVEGALIQNRQLMAESSTSFLPDIAVEGEKPAMTATESLIRNNASITLTSAVLNQLYNQSESLWREISRRICLKNSDDPMTKTFQKKIKEQGIPGEVLDVDCWDILPNRVMGGGNKAVELTAARSMFEIAPRLAQYNPDALRITSKDLVLALTDDAQKAELLVPDNQELVDQSDAERAANAFGSLMEGTPYPNPQGVNRVVYTMTLIQLMAEGMKPLEGMIGQPQALGTAADRVTGLVNVGNHIGLQIQIMAMDQSFKEETSQAERSLNDLMLELKRYAQMIQDAEEAQAEQAQQGMNPEAQGKLMEMQLMAQTKAQIKSQDAALKRQHKDIAFEEEEQRKTAKLAGDLQRQRVQTIADVQALDLKTSSEMLARQKEAEAKEAEELENEL